MVIHYHYDCKAVLYSSLPATSQLGYDSFQLRVCTIRESSFKGGSAPHNGLERMHAFNIYRETVEQSSSTVVQ